MLNPTEFLADVRAEVCKLAQTEAVIVMFRLDKDTPPEKIEFGIVIVGRMTIPFIWDAADFETLDTSKAFMIDECRKRLASETSIAHEQRLD